MLSALASPPLRSLAAATAALLCCCWLELADAALEAATSTDGGNDTTMASANSSATPPHVTTATNATGHSECPILQENSGGSGDDACRWSNAFYAIVVLAPVVLIAAVVVTPLLCLRRQRNRQGQENVEAKAADDKPQGRRKKNDYTGPPIPPVKVQQDPIDGDYSLVPDDGDHIYGNEESVYVNTELDLEQLTATAGSGGGGGDDGRGGATVARGTSNDADEIDHLPQAPIPPAARGLSKNRVLREEDSGSKAARGPKAGAAVAAVGRAPRQRTAGGSREPSEPELEAESAGRSPRQHAAGGGGKPSKPLKAQAAAAAAARTPIADKLARAVAAKRQETEMEKQACGQETEPVYENIRR